MRLTINDFTGLFPTPSISSARLKRLDPQEVVDSWGTSSNRAADPPEKVNGFVFIRDQQGQVGWVDQSNLDGFQRPPIHQGNFIVACIAAEADVNDLSDTAPWYVSSDFIVARALLETGLSNDVAQAAGPNGVGPLLVTQDEWAQFLAESNEQDQFSVSGWDDPIEQIWAAAFRMRRDAKAISFIKRAAGIGTTADPFIPNYLYLILSYITGRVEAATAIAECDPKSQSVVQVLDASVTPLVTDGILSRYSWAFGTRITPLTVADAITAVTSELDKNLALAFKLAQKYAPDQSISLPTTAPGKAPAGGVLGELIASGEGNYDSYNRGRAGDSRTKLNPPVSAMTIKEILSKQSLPPGNSRRLFAVGKYQIIPSTMQGAIAAIALNINSVFDAFTQEHIFRQYLISRKRPKVKNFITGNGGSRSAAQLALAQEFASVASPLTGRSYYAGTGGNAASISSEAVAQALDDERRQYISFIAQGLSPSQAWEKLSGPTPLVSSVAATSTVAIITSSVGSGGTSGLNILVSVKYLFDHAESRSTGLCARYVRRALEEGGIKAIDPPERPVNAKDYGPVLLKRKFKKINTKSDFKDYIPKEGDVVVIQPYSGGNPAGHIAMYSGSNWISDFVQRDVWAGPGYRAKKPSALIYRP